MNQRVVSGKSENLKLSLSVYRGQRDTINVGEVVEILPFDLATSRIVACNVSKTPRDLLNQIFSLLDA
ncbi:MAG TPA: hypothetical protein VKV04_12980 [Verrucomicrobiae bacterium]|nr:hypothetical protein [Verrucomicrobiae bacterium]